VKTRATSGRRAVIGVLAVMIVGITLGLLINLTVHVSSALASGTPSTPSTPSTPPSARAAAAPGRAAPMLLADTQGQAAGQPVDAVGCESQEQALFHIHSHLAVFVDGRQMLVPAGVGIVPPVVVDPTGRFVEGGSCLYWLHSHDASGVIHVESPVERAYTLGDFFAIWNQPLGPGVVGPAHGRVRVYVNGVPMTGDPRQIQLNAHAVIQLDVGTPVAPQPFTFPAGL
jgi:hypothetical protein